MPRKVILVDVDGTVADTHEALLERYNREWGDSLVQAQITTWHMHEHVKPECGTRVYDYFQDPVLYDCVQPIRGSRSAVEVLRSRGHRIIFVTSCFAGTADAKHNWLVKHGFLPNAAINRDYVVLTDKHLLYGDALVDDKAGNIKPFKGKRVLFSQPWNTLESGQFYRANNWLDVVHILSR